MHTDHFAFMFRHVEPLPNPYHGSTTHEGFGAPDNGEGDGGGDGDMEAEEIRMTLHEFAGLQGLDLGEGFESGMNGEDKEGGDGGLQEAAVHTYDWHVQNMTAPLYPGARLTLKQLCYTLVVEKLKQNLTTNFIERFLKLLSGVLLPAGNTCPRSWYMLRKLVGWRDVGDIEYHVCINDCHLFPWVHSSEYHFHANDTCPTCGTARFRTKSQRAGGVKFVPQKVFYYFGLHFTVQSQFFANPVWCSMRGKGREEFQHDFYSSQEAIRLNTALGGSLFHQDNSVYQIGMDFAEPFNTRSYSSGVVGLRCRDIPHAHRCKLAFCAPLVIIPGPQQPKDIAPYLQLIFQEIEIAGREGERGMEGWDRGCWILNVEKGDVVIVCLFGVQGWRCMMSTDRGGFSIRCFWMLGLGTHLL